MKDANGQSLPNQQSHAASNNPSRSTELPRSIIHENTAKGVFDIDLGFIADSLFHFKALARTLKRRFGKLSDNYLAHFESYEAPGVMPFRAELFNAEQMEQHGKLLASEHSLSRFGMRNRLLNRLDENEDVLLSSYKLLNTAISEKSRIVPAGEWLLDNFYLIEEQIRTARSHLPIGYSRELPRLAEGASRGLPRVYDIALEVIAHGDGRIDGELLSRFVTAYQTITPLTIGELWAIPIMLRLALIENLRRVAARITTARVHVNQAQEWANLMVDVAEKEPKNLILVIADMARSNPPMVSSFVAELARRLQGHGSSLALSLTWIKERLAELSLTIEQMVLSETQQQAADQVSISNSINSLRFLGATDWRVFVENMSVVEKILLTDIGGVYGKMDFATRDSYRRVIDRLAKRIRLSEAEVARAAIVLAGINAASAPDASVLQGGLHNTHVGYYLVDKGLPRLEKVVKARVSLLARVHNTLARFPLALHLGSILLLTTLFTAGLVHQAALHDLDGWRLGLFAFLSALATSQLASGLTNWFAILFVKPKLLPRMDYSQGLPREMRTLVVIPSLLTSASGIEDLLEALEVRFLGNQDQYLHFSLLTDFSDAKTETLASDASLVRQAKLGIEALNEKYASEGNDRFFLFHRPRHWNPAEQVWMGYERKRGKLADLNAFLRGATQHRFSLIVGNTDFLTHVQYVITLDTDTQLPRDSAREFIGAMAHPLNRPRYDQTGSKVVGGYGVLQPRMAASLSGTHRSRYALLYGNEPGIDPYTRSVSDVYQDLFAEGSFIGKGIYDVDAFEQTLKERFPENRILSHDLLEGCYARSGLISDVHLYEEHPTRYLSDVSRRERWIRGDWQIASWLFSKVPGANGDTLRNPLALLARWKILDNLVRSLAPMALLLMLLVGWFASTAAWFWSLAVVGIILFPALLIAWVDMWRKPDEVHVGQHLALIAHSVGRNCVQTIFRIACLPHEAIYSMEAILRSAGRLLFTRKRLLEWKPFNDAVGQSESGLLASYSAMWCAPIMAILTATGLGLLSPDARLAATPILLLWFVAPVLAWWISQPLRRKKVQLRTEELIFLRKIARKTWAFFERFVGPEDNWLPPDNIQEYPGPIVAHRTSPTNMGLSLLANLSAYDFGYISTGVFIERSGNALGTMQRLERHQGHLYNWYDTLTLNPLPPRYISSVDSGNLAGHLLTLRAGLVALPDQPLINVCLFYGLRDTLLLIDDTLHKLASAIAQNHSAILQTTLASLHAQIKAACTTSPTTLTAILLHLEPIARSAVSLNEIINEPELASFALEPVTEFGIWIDVFAKQAQTALAELMHMAPWLAHTASPANLSNFAGFDGIPSLRQLAEANYLLSTIDTVLDASGSSNRALSGMERDWLAQKRWLVALGLERAAERLASIATLIAQTTDLASMQYEFLYDRTRQLLAIGYNVDEFRRDNSFYDLLASEARLCNFVAIAQGQLPQESWFALGRVRTVAGAEPVLMSWSGSMFEYLMPNLVMPTYEGTLLDQTCRAAVARQIAYGKQRSMPWGISESGYNTVDANLNYQYHAFGVPGLGLKRGLADDSVVAPYASVMALMIAPEEACHNLQHLSDIGMEGRYGFYEAVDYTAARLTRGQDSAVVQSFMVHHQGMSLLSLAYLLLDRPMQKRFESDPLFQATLLLLQERIPKASVVPNAVAKHAEGFILSDDENVSVHLPFEADTPTPEVQLLSNGRYHVMVTNAGAGYSRWNELSVTRWREDSTCDNWGSFLYLRDVDTGEFWSNTHQPTLRRADIYEATFNEWRAEYRRRDHDIEAYSEIVVSPEDDIELRRVKLTNRSRRPRTIELTSYAEVVLATQAADIMQTSFGNLFVQTEIIEDRRAILCARRPRSETEQTPWMFHVLAAHGAAVSAVSYETDRMKFLGRGNSTAAPQALLGTETLSGSQGSVLDPIVAIRCRVTLEAEQSILLDFVSGAADSRAASMAMVEKYQDRHLADRVFDLAYTHGGVTVRQINATEADAVLYRRLGRSVVYANATLRADTQLLVQNRRGQSGLWGYAISGDLPIVLVKIASSDHIELARQMIQCHAYWRLKGLKVDLVIWNEDHVSYRQRLQDQIMGLIATGLEAHSIDRPGGIFVRSAEQISIEDRILLQTVARAIIIDSEGSLVEQLNRRTLPDKKIARLVPTRRITHKRVPSIFRRSESFVAQEGLSTDSQKLLLSHHLGGFSKDGREYTITTNANNMTPVPWSNVLANPHFGSVITESGLAYTWSENAHEFRLSPWSDDPVGAAGGEAVYLRDEETGQFWSPTPLPKCNITSLTTGYTTRHGFGYSVFEHSEGGIHTELWVYVDLEQSVKFSVLKVRNQSGRARRLSATGYVEWVLGDLRSKSAMHIVTDIDASSGALFARNAYNTEFAGRVAFFDVDDLSRSLTGDRTEFLGRNGSLANPDALTRTHLSGKLGAALDPCGAIQVPFELADGQEREIIFRLGAGQDIASARSLALGLRKTGSARIALQKVQDYWQHTLSAVQVETPDPALNVLANGWLLYQTLACRIWARSGFYQSGGAYGFRDQLQDSMALIHAQPQLLREHLLRCAQRQYPEGDVQHWWHPPVGRGVRTRCSDDYLWLPLVTCRYINSTGDTGVLNENLHFLEGRSLAPDEESYYDLPGHTAESASLYQHCVRAIEQGLRFGEHGLPLMGSGDWNDGMNLVGIEGKGESVWLGFFLYEVLNTFAKIALQQNDQAFAQRCYSEAEKLRQNIELNAWDGGWYRRAYFDNGTMLGSAVNSECAIDSISQSWSVLSGAGSLARTQVAMNALDEHLVRRDSGIIQLLDPPFDVSSLNPGYIKGYVPGVRENGGQYTHAAVWAAMAFAALGDSKRAWELLAIINPLNHTRNAQEIALYKAEPYVVAADVYAIAPHTGRGGWSWYTGSAGLLYRLIVESLLGIKREANRLFITPCLPPDWKTYAIQYRFGSTVYRLEVMQGDNISANSMVHNGIEQPDHSIVLVDDQQTHLVLIRLKPKVI